MTSGSLVYTALAENWAIVQPLDWIPRWLKVKRYRPSSLEQVISKLQGVNCHTGSHNVTHHPTQVNPHLTGHFASPVLQRGTACRQTFELLLL